MSRALLISLVSTVYVVSLGCGRRPPEPTPTREPIQGGQIRIVAGDPATRRALLLSAVARPLLSKDLALESAPPDAAGCHRFVIASGATFPNGTPVRPSDVIDAWEAGLGDPGREHRWLLEPLLDRGGDRRSLGDGARADGRTLVLCPHRPTPDLPARLGHPDLWLWRVSPSTGYREGPGPFAESSSGALEPNTYFGGSGPYLDSIEWLPRGNDDASLVFELDQADLGVVYGRDADGFGESAAVERLPAWDRTYYLWMQPHARWINDPLFRRWIADRIDRSQAIRYLFAGRGSPAYSLRSVAAETPGWDPVEHRPISGSSVPRVELTHDQGDPHARALALRIQATLRGAGVEIRLDPGPHNEIDARLARGEGQMVLRGHRARTTDPVLALAAELRSLPGAEAALSILERAVERSDPDDRRRAAEYAELAVLLDARLVPLVHLHAWLATRPGLRVPLDRDGRPLLGRSWWTR